MPKHILLLALLACAPSAQAGEAVLLTPSGTISVGVTSLREARFQGVVRQQYDFSCGSAALATLLTHHYGRPTTEQEAFQAMFAAGNQDAIRKFGFSLFEMQRYLAEIGIASDGFRIGLDKLAEVGLPGITLIETKGYNHFVVVKGVRDGMVLVGDPALGLKAIPRDQFEAMWKGVIFVIRDHVERGREGFNQSADWAVQRKAPFGTALSRNGLATFSVAMPGLFEF